ncbi:MAG: hypothetical protein H7833_02355 [Magnetococcus sp. DMHC-1]
MTTSPRLRRVLVVSPRFPPLNAPDMHRIRISLPHFREFGWEPQVLTVQAEPGDGLFDPLLLDTIPEDVPIHRVAAIPRQRLKYLGIGDVGLRAWWPLYRRGVELLRQHHFDVVYFSTTVVVSMTLGRLWRSKTGTPFVLDIQDPWRSFRHFWSKGDQVPGGRLKFVGKYLLAGLLERFTMQAVAHVISVSPGYCDDFMQRFPRLGEQDFTVLPFGGTDLDFRVLACRNLPQNFFQPDDGLIHWVYTGRSSMDMAYAFRILFGVLAGNRKKNPQRWGRVRLHFIGTSYSATSGKTVEPVAREFGLEQVVFEHPLRVPYFEALKLLTDSHGIVFTSSDDPGYSASKIYPLILARKPLLGLVHQGSIVARIMADCQAGSLVLFNARDPLETSMQHAENVLETFLDASIAGVAPQTDWEAFAPYTAREMTRRQCRIFDRVCNPASFSS